MYPMCVQSWAVGNTGERSETELQCGELPCGTFSGIGHISGEKGFGRGGRCESWYLHISEKLTKGEKKRFNMFFLVPGPEQDPVCENHFSLTQVEISKVDLCNSATL